MIRCCSFTFMSICFESVCMCAMRMYTSKCTIHWNLLARIFTNACPEKSEAENTHFTCIFAKKWKKNTQNVNRSPVKKFQKFNKTVFSLLLSFSLCACIRRCWMFIIRRLFGSFVHSLAVYQSHYNFGVTLFSAHIFWMQ